ncbi:MAG: hypothetical protein KAX44_09250, partial [Candidatus Brocadiae bacterium]|nr:hypothetical protein [Candidatus Brocadiia bacterium]
MRGSNNQARGTSELQPLSAGNAGPLRRLYDWTIHWAETPYALWALFLLAFASSSFFPVPPDVLLIAMALGAPKKSLRYAGICLVGSVVGGCAGYLIGMCFFEAVGRPILSFYHHLARFDQLQVQFAEHGFLFIFVAALTPIPYKVFTIAAGVSHTYVPLTVLIAASVVGRGLRFFALGVLLRLFGNRVKRFIDRYFNLLTIAFVVLLVLGFVCVKIFLDKKRPAEGPALTPAILAPVKTDARSPGGVHMLSEEAKQTLLNVARQSVEAAIRNGPLPKFDIEDEELNQGQGAFVT